MTAPTKPAQSTTDAVRFMSAAWTVILCVAFLGLVLLLGTGVVVALFG